MAPSYSLSHLPDQVLLRDLAALVARDRTTTAALLAHIAEVDARKLYVPAGYPSMFAYCLDELHLSEDATYKRIQAARGARQFPALFCAVADGRLHLAAVCLLAPHLTQETADELLAAATHRRKSEIEVLLAQRFPRPDIPVRVESLSPPPSLLLSQDELSPGTVEGSVETAVQLAPGQVESLATPHTQHATGRVAAPNPSPTIEPLAPERFALQLTIDQSTHDKLRYAQQLLSHQISARDVAQVLDRALDALIMQLEKRKFAATTRPRESHGHPTAAGSRHIPAHVRRAVWKRDGGQCTFVSETGHRCPSRTLLEFDHLDEVARGGQATVERTRLRCRAHNQYGAECTFGTEFMAEKRQEARRKRQEERRVGARSRARAKAHAEAAAGARAKEQDVVACLRTLGFNADESRRAAALCHGMPDDPIEQQVRVALSYFHRPRAARIHAGRT